MTKDQVDILAAFEGFGKVKPAAAYLNISWMCFRPRYIEALRAMARAYQPECAGFIEKLVVSQQKRIIREHLPRMYANLTPTMDDPAFN